jgi:hypothetical protein
LGGAWGKPHTTTKIEVTSSSACAALTNGTLGTSFEEFLKRESDCVQGGYATESWDVLGNSFSWWMEKWQLEFNH